ncbi:DNA polymerase III subunit gamma/tau [Atopobacter phocae]|uniref:DNA polymerase III subunit gamma/tau n=1 Tax=Atopobacter phocae TaxID=136492 RepID=UPI0004712CD8|nr:DNA polymerase III subunit gamma/tau [Atopobacter phocae]
MAYQALYRVWRPQTFEEVIGQPTIVQTLRYMVSENKTSHAYLFCGPRGTGKTSVAKILSKAVNCLNLKNGEPCNECASCVAIRENRMSDVIEIDAASNNGVDEIRDIRDKVRYAPTEGRVKVYIIDEVHMLSIGAFNALLKTLEEPPANVLFILATTEPHKIPATILSRTQRFDFRRIPKEDIEQQLEKILTSESVTFDPDALSIISESVHGGMRDALSILDQALAYDGANLTKEHALIATGSLSKELLRQYIDAVMSRNVETALEIIHQAYAAGKEASRMIEEMMGYTRDLLTKKINNDYDANVLYEMVDRLTTTQRDMRYSNNPLIYMELLTVQLSELPQIINKNISKEISTADEYHEEPMPPAPYEMDDNIWPQIEQLQAEVRQLQDKIKQMTTGGAIEKEVRTPLKPDAVKYKVNIREIHQVLDIATKPAITELNQIWPDILQLLSNAERSIFKLAEIVAASDKGFVMAFPYELLAVKANEEGPRSVVLNYLNKQIDYQGTYTTVTIDDWKHVRKEYILTARRNKTSESASHQTESLGENGTEEVQPDITQQAIDLFGEQHVLVKKSRHEE